MPTRKASAAPQRQAPTPSLPLPLRAAEGSEEKMTSGLVPPRKAPAKRTDDFKARRGEGAALLKLPPAFREQLQVLSSYLRPLETTTDPAALQMQLKKAGELNDQLVVAVTDLLTRAREDESWPSNTRGQFVVGFAHEARNSLMAVQGVLFALPLMQTAERIIVRDACTAVSELRSLITQLSTTRSTKPSATAVDTSQLLKSTRSLLRPSMPVGGTLALRIEQTLPAYSDQGVLRRVLINLVRNAQYAAAPGRPLEIELSNCLEGPHVLLSVRDNGSGIAEEHRARIFQPRFSTKGQSGNGIGLATCRDSLAQLGGSLSFETALDVGTTFTIQLPAVPQAPFATVDVA